MALNPDLFTALYKPDVLMCLADLSNDEVFTPPDIANQVLDMLPQELFRDPNTKFLDPALKSGVFLREIAKRLIAGLADKIPNLQDRCDHIFKNQLYGIAITELTSLLGRRSVYCSKYPNSPFSITKFDDVQGNIVFHKIRHKWDHAGVNGKCIFCGTAYGGDIGDINREGMETHAYEFIHTVHPEEIFNMKFDVIVSNPPYQLNVGVKKENYAIPIYQKFVEQAKKLNPRFLTMIIPARWYAGGRGLDAFRDNMLHDHRLVEIHDYPNSTDCFPGVDIAGGICFFLWDRDHKKDCKVTTHKGKIITSEMTRPLLERNMNSFIRQNEAVSILQKVQKHNEPTFDLLVSPQTPFGFVSSFREFSENQTPNTVKYYTYGYVGYVKDELIKKNRQLVSPHKVYISAAQGERGPYPYFFLGKPFYGEPNSCCSQTYLVIGPFDSKDICDNVMSYISTKFFRCMIMMKKNAQHNMSYVFACVPQQDFSKPWTDEELYKKYGITQEEIAFIDSMIKPMDLGGNE